MLAAPSSRRDPLPSASVVPVPPSPSLAVDLTDLQRAASPSAGMQTSPLANSIPASNDAIHLRVLSQGQDSSDSSDESDDDDRSKIKQVGSTIASSKRHESPLMRTDTSFARAFGTAPLLSDRSGVHDDGSNSPLPATLLMAHSPPQHTRPRLSSSTPSTGSGVNAAAAAAFLKKPPAATFELRSPFSPSPVIQQRSLAGPGAGAGSDDEENKFSPSSCVRTLPPHQYADSFEEERSEPMSVQMASLGGQLYIHDTPLVQPRTLGAAQGATPRITSTGMQSARKLTGSSPHHSKHNSHHAAPNLLVLPPSAAPAHSRSSSSTHSLGSHAWGNTEAMGNPSSATSSAVASPAVPANIALAMPPPITLPASSNGAAKPGEVNGTTVSSASASGGGGRGGADSTGLSIASIKPPSPFQHNTGLRSPGASPEPPAPDCSDPGSPSPPGPAVPKAKTPCLRSCSFASMIAVVAALVLVAAVLVVGWIGRKATVDIAATMANFTRDSLFTDTRRHVSAEFALGLSDVQGLSLAAQERFLSFHNASSLSNTTGWLSVLTSVACLSRQLRGMGIVNQRRVGMFVTAATNQNSAATEFVHGLGGQEIAVIVGAAADDEAEAQWQLYHPQAIRPDSISRHAPVLRPRAPLDQDQPVSDIARYLGQGSAFDFEKLRVADKIDLLAGRRMRAENVTAFWDTPRQFLPRLDNGTYLQPEEHALTSVYSMRVYSRMESGWIQPVDSVTLGDAPLAVGTIDLRLFTQSFVDMRLGDHGLAFLVTPNGEVVSSSNLAYNHTTVTDDDGDTMMSKVLPLLRACRLITSTPVDSLSALDAIDMSERVCTGRLDWDHGTFDMRAQLLDQASTGLPFTIVVVTHDEDFYGARLHAALIQAIWSSSLTLAVGVLLISLAASFLARPLGSVIRFMGRVRHVAALPNSAHKRSQMQKLLRKWDRQHGHQHHSQVAQSEPPRISSRSRSMSNGADLSGVPPKRHWCGVQSREVALIEHSFGEFIQTWAGYDELEALNHSKRQFIRYIFHEVRVPFNALVLGIEQLQADVSPHHAMLGDAMDTLAILHEQTEVVTHILNDVLSLQKIEDGALTLEFQVFCLERMIRATLYSFKAPCQERQLKIKLNLANLNQHMQSKMDALDAPMAASSSFGDLKRHSALVTARSELRFGIFGDHHRLRQVLSNYASNAIKFSRKAGDDIRVTLFFDSLELTDEFKTSLTEMQARRESKEKEAAAMSGPAGLAAMSLLADQFALESEALLEYFSANPVATVGVRVSVVDQGVGIPEEHLKNLFTPYMQINAGTLQKSKGTGLGLSVSKSIMALHGGSVACHSIEGAGAEFTFSIPCLEVRMLPSSTGGDTVRNSAVTTPITVPRMTPKNPPAAMPLRSLLPSGEAKPASSGPTYGPTSSPPLPDANSAALATEASAGAALSTASSGSTSSFRFPVTHVTRAGLARRSSNTPSRASLPRHLAQQNQNALAVVGASAMSVPAVQSAAVVESDLEVISAASSGSSSTSTRASSQTTTERTSTFVVIHSPPTAASHSPLTVSRPIELPPPALIQGSWALEGIVPAPAPAPAAAASASPVATLQPGSPAPMRSGSPSPRAPTPVDESKLLQLPRQTTVTSAGVDRTTVKRQLSSSDDDLAPPSHHPNLSITTSPQQSTVNLLTLSTPTNILTPSAILDAQSTTASSAAWPIMQSPIDNGGSPSNMASTTMHSSGNSRGSGQMTAMSTAASTPVAKPVAKSGVRVLVVEDSAPNRKLLCALLVRLGCKVSAAEHGEECINLMKPILALSPMRRATINQKPMRQSSASTSSDESEADTGVVDFAPAHGPEAGKHNLLDQMVPFDIILMDNSMPVMDGMTATRILRSAGITIPIVGVTGNTLEEDVKAFLAAGANEILPKPVSAAKLEKVLRDYTAYGRGAAKKGAGGAAPAAAASSTSGGASTPTGPSVSRTPSSTARGAPATAFSYAETAPQS